MALRLTTADRIVWKKSAMWAAQRVRRAVVAGELTDLRSEVVNCLDCGVNRAVAYDHRDYSKPLEVQPVCHSCNLKRGPAVLSSPVPRNDRDARRTVLASVRVTTEEHDLFRSLAKSRGITLAHLVRSTLEKAYNEAFGNGAV